MRPLPALRAGLAGWVMAALATLAMLVCAPAHAQAAAAGVARPAGDYSASVATEWFALALQLTQQTPGFSAPVASRALAYLGLALYESKGYPLSSSRATNTGCPSSYPTPASPAWVVA